MNVIEVAAGLIEDHGRYLVAKRAPGVHLAGFWEFPGGKREAGESFEECLRRELHEELNVRIDLPVSFRIVRHAYPDKTVELHFFRCTIQEGTAVALGSSEIRWVYPHEMKHLSFPPADQTIVDALLQNDPGIRI
ncbi:Mutator MutT protein [Nitrospira sp. KM1]|uniref:(deoxy)nucleoside triphosphate pyrophosphohydrolase n=1 Tax=Nitrospira sp. KM1 TaxID=1936990 RepID=UPI0013A7A4AE|nr:(deoxy)nucleoside triphosphate pyrophosphohydrolase [Nitrospira sp. KM1]BCA53397.1 Mutator MutT protein [Nitrospira sp. KM1]